MLEEVHLAGREGDRNVDKLTLSPPRVELTLPARSRACPHCGWKSGSGTRVSYRLCESICQVVAVQKKSDLSHIFSALPMCERSKSSFNLLCHEATFDMSEKRINGLDPLRSLLEMTSSNGPTAFKSLMDTPWARH